MNFRLATIEDVPGIIKVSIDTWRTAYQDIFPADYLNNLSYEESEEKWRKRFINPEKNIFFYIAETEAKKIIGFILGGFEQQDLTLKIPGIRKYVGELRAIYVLKEYQRSGIGVKLVKMVVERLLEKNINSMIVWVLKDNPNGKFYEILGGKYIGQKMLEKEGVDYVAFAYGWDDIRQILSY
ncbi:MAG: GNAT family N-acetyltransferase [Candidatus Lokiarchaeota archaeon]|jgi:GNAT superfamily N-acetyltransferase|nr:GNAT family N-acetyltransferase [Candidatus Lokiarchaeota archaeon]